jgi:hypothetical protein
MSRNAVVIASFVLFAAAPVAFSDVPAECMPLKGAAEKILLTPHHLYGTTTQPSGQTRTSEALNAGGVEYLLIGGKWTKAPSTLADRQAFEQQSWAKATNVTCRFLKNDVVNGEAVVVYSQVNKTEAGTSEAQVWISKASGLILRQETAIGMEGGRNLHISTRYEFANVQPPK